MTCAREVLSRSFGFRRVSDVGPDDLATIVREADALIGVANAGVDAP
jgi:hypothetical protein